MPPKKGNKLAGRVQMMEQSLALVKKSLNTSKAGTTGKKSVKGKKKGKGKKGSLGASSMNMLSMVGAPMTGNYRWPLRPPSGKLGYGETWRYGTSTLVSVNLTAPLAAGEALAHVPLDPSLYPKTTWGAESSLWNKWRPDMLRVRVSSGATSMYSGRYGLAWDSGAMELWPGGTDGLNIFSGMSPKVDAHLWENSSMMIPSGILNTAKHQFLLRTHGEDEESHGTVILICQNGTGTFDGPLTFNIELDWSCLFSGGELHLGYRNTIYADAGYENYKTDSVSDWGAGQRLSLKHVAGGGLVSFKQAQPGVVYELDPNATLMAFEDTAGTKQKAVKFGTLIHNYSYNAMAVFFDQAQAETYCRTGNFLDAEKWYKIGPDVEPGNPAWTKVDSSGFRFKVQRPGKLKAISGPFPPIHEPTEPPRSSSGLADVLRTLPFGWNNPVEGVVEGVDALSLSSDDFSQLESGEA